MPLALRTPRWSRLLRLGRLWRGCFRWRWFGALSRRRKPHGAVGGVPHALTVGLMQRTNANKVDLGILTYFTDFACHIAIKCGDRVTNANITTPYVLRLFQLAHIPPSPTDLRPIDVRFGNIILCRKMLYIKHNDENLWPQPPQVRY